MDECSLGTDTCDVNAGCIDTDGSFNCICKVGFSGDGESCCKYSYIISYNVETLRIAQARHLQADIICIIFVYQSSSM